MVLKPNVLMAVVIRDPIAALLRQMVTDNGLIQICLPIYTK